ncbi:MAG: EAL domain-containing protein [Meiothermus sp.]|nr:EAL domain-containing protein [Meiothermus sp.]
MTESLGDPWLHQMFRGVVETNSLLTRQDFQTQIPRVMEILGQALRADRVYIDQFHPHETGRTRVSRRHEWCGRGVRSSMGDPSTQNRPPRDVLHRRLLRGEVLEYTYTAQALPPGLDPPTEPGNPRSFLEVPIFVGRALWGLLGFEDRRHERRWGEDAVGVLRTTAASLGEAVQRGQTEESLRQSEARNRELLAASERQRQRLGLLLRLSQTLGHELEPGPLYRAAVEAISATFGYGMVSLYLRQGQELVMQHQVGYPEWLERIPLGNGVMARCLRSGQPVLIEEARQDPDFVYPLPDICSDIAVPLVVRGQAVGVINLESCTHHFGPDDLELMTAVAAQVSLAVERTLSFASLREQEAFYRNVLDNLADAVTLFEGGVFSYVNPAGLRTMGAERPEQVLGLSFTDWLKHASVPGSPLPSESYLQALEHSTPIPFTEDQFRNLHGEVVDIEIAITPTAFNGKQVCLSTWRDIRHRKRAEQQVRASEARFRALVETSPDGIIEVGPDGTILYANASYLRLVGAEEAGQVVGQSVLRFLHPDHHHLARQRMEEPGAIPFVEEACLRLDGSVVPVEVGAARLEAGPHGPATLMGIVRDISERKAQQHTIERLAYHDTLTGLPNRRMLREQAERILSQSQRGGRKNALLYLDLNRFKEVNDTLGHEAGDKLLMQVARRLEACVRQGDVLARLGGDEFAVLLQDIRPEEITPVASRVLEALQRPFALEGAHLHVGASMGIGLYPQDGQNLDDLMRVADVAMYRAKETEGGFIFYSPELDRYSRERFQLLHDLRGALQGDEIFLEYQPILDTASGRWGKLEALVRWQHPVRGRVAPGQFIPLAEETGLIREVDRRVLRQACLEANSHGLPISVNISARSLYDSGFAQAVEAALRAGRISGDRLHLEITETALIQDLPRAKQHLTALRALGVHIALDDFGVGNSSMGYLKDLPIDCIKIDRSFVSGIGKDPREEALLKTILAIGEGLGLPTVAEGVETPDQVAWLTERGCRLLQGFGIARPQEREQLLAVVRPAASA